MPGTPDLIRLESALRDLLAPDAIAIDTSPYVLDGLTPALAAFPSTAAEVAAILVAADHSNAAVVPWGGGSHQALGMPLAGYDLALDLRRLNQIIEYEPADLTVTVEAGMDLTELQRHLAEHGQRLPIAPPRGGTVTIGGVLATNASGPDRYRYGTARDVLIGVTFALPNGELAKSGGRVVKNVAGYDLGKLQIGALGTLGVITQATFKVTPLPAHIEMAQADAGLAELMSITSRLTESLLAIHGMVLFKQPSNSKWNLQVQFAGGAAAVERSLRDLTALAGESQVEPDRDLRGPALLRLLTQPLVVRASVRSDALASVASALDELHADIAAYPASGTVYGAWEDPTTAEVDALRSLRRVCIEDGQGALVLERAPIELKRAVDVWGDAPASIDLMRRLKAELDPNHILNPGRYVGGI